MDISKRKKRYRLYFQIIFAVCMGFLTGYSVYMIVFQKPLYGGIVVAYLFFMVLLTGACFMPKYGLWVEFQDCRDGVTNGPDEVQFQEAFEARTDSIKNEYAFLYVNIKKFSKINSEYGHSVGNVVLRAVYQAMREVLSEGELISRVYSDTYYLLVKADGVERLWERINELDDAVYYLKDIPMNKKIYLSIGGYLITGEDEVFADVVECANFCRTESLHASDENTHVEIYNYTLMDTRKRSRQLQEMSEMALEKGHFKMYLQPKYELDNETLAEAEALIRWEDPREGMIPLNEFMPAFEESGFVRRIDYFILESALQLIEKWIAEGKEPIRISVNLSKSHFSDNKFFEKRFMPILSGHSVPPKYIEFEISESILLDQEGNLIQFVKMLREMGYSCSMDDFGSGYSSLNTMKSLPVSVIKLDQRMFSEEEKERGKIVSRGVIKIARELGIKVVAEGVNTREYVDFLKEHECDMIQGYYFGKPMPVDEFEFYMERGSSL